MSSRRCVVVAVAGFLGFVPGCGGGGAGEPVDAGAVDARAGFSCGTQLVFSGSGRDVAGDGTNVYVSLVAPGASSETLAIVAEAGLTTIATADSFVLASSGDTLFYAAATGTTYELHERVGGADHVLGSVTSMVPVRIAGNATDLYVFGSDATGTSTLWRSARGGDAPVEPAVVTTVQGVPRSFALGATVAVLDAGDEASVISLADPAEPTPVAGAHGTLAFSGDRAYVLGSMLLTSHAIDWWIDQVLPTQERIQDGDVLINGGVSELIADAHHLY
jgi:hypothetical protein